MQLCLLPCPLCPLTPLARRDFTHHGFTHRGFTHRQLCLGPTRPSTNFSEHSPGPLTQTTHPDHSSDPLTRSRPSLGSTTALFLVVPATIAEAAFDCTTRNRTLSSETATALPVCRFRLHARTAI